MFIVMEIQTGNTVAVVPPVAYENRNDAENKYHTILAAAATSEVPKHAAVMLTEEGTRLKSECYYHAPTPNEEQE